MGTPTRFAELEYEKHGADLWRIIDVTDARHPAPVGPHYKTKAELLADLERFAEVFGAAGAIAGREVAQMTAEDKANARLIAAAPDLLEACESALSGLEADMRQHLGRMAEAEFQKRWASHGIAQILRAALKKAKGDE